MIPDLEQAASSAPSSARARGHLLCVAAACLCTAVATASLATDDEAPAGDTSNPDEGSSSAATASNDDPLAAGVTVDYPYDGSDIGRPERAWTGRAFVHPSVLASDRPVPLVVFLHGLNKELIAHRWMGGGNEGDVRAILARLMDRGKIRPTLVAGPGSVVPSAVSTGASFVQFDLERFLQHTQRALAGHVAIDESAIVVAGHSGAGCSARGGLAAVAQHAPPVYAILNIDTCMPGALATALGRTAPTTHVVTTYQTLSWSRDFAAFELAFERSAAEADPPAEANVLRSVVRLEPPRRPHDETVPMTLERFLPELLPPL